MNKKNLSFLYDLFMIVVIFLSLLPLLVRRDLPILYGLDHAVVFIFGLDYLLQAFWNYRYCVSFMGIIDFLSLLPALSWVRFLKLVRLFRAVRAFKLLRFWRSSLIHCVLKKQKTALLLVWSLAVVYIFMCAVVMFNVETSTFEDFFEALYWSCMSLTSVGYGDVVPVTKIGRIVAMISTFVGMAFVALPTGIISAGYMAELAKENESEKKKEYHRHLG